MSKSKLKRLATQIPWPLKDWSYEEMKADYEKELVGCWIDPPTGWMYGFPAIYDGKMPFRDWIESKGYPMEDWDKWAKNHVRTWKNVEGA